MKVSRNAHRDEHTICEKLYGRIGFVFFRKPVFFIVVFLFIYLSIYYLSIYLLFIYLFLGGGVGRQKSLSIFLNYI